MTEQFDPERYEAFERLLTKPDPPDLPRRGHVLHCAGDPNRRVTQLPRLQMVWLQRWCLEACGEEQLPPARRHQREQEAVSAAV
jgi:hypothetical protein